MFHKIALKLNQHLGKGGAGILALLLAMSLAVCSFVFFKKFAVDPVGMAIGTLSYLAFSCGLIYLAGKYSIDATKTVFVSCLSIVSLLGKLMLVITLRGSYQQLGDFSFMHKFASLLYESGLNSDKLKTFYDASAYFDRVLLFFLPMKALFGANDLLAVQIGNCLFATGILILTYLICAAVFDEKTARWAALLTLLFPLHSLDVLTYTHDLPGIFLVLLGFFLAFRILAAEKLHLIIAMSLTIGVILFAVRLQRGLHPVMLIFLAVLAVQVCISKLDYARWLKAIICLVVLPTLVYGICAKKFDDFKSHSGIKVNSSRYSFMARGWSVAAKGEYDGFYEQIDKATPPDLKDRSQLGLIISQLTYNKKEVMVLPVVKAAKFFLVGFASNPELSFTATHQGLLNSVAVASRLIFAIGALGLAIVGCLELLWQKNMAPYQVALVLFPLLCVAAIALLGETSPRYSYVVHFVLAALGGGAAAKGRAGVSEITGNFVGVSGELLPYGLAAAIGYCAFMALLLLSIPKLGAAYKYMDMRKATSPRAAVRDLSYLSPFEQVLAETAPSRSDSASPLEGSIVLPARGDGGKYFFYVQSLLPGRSADSGMSCIAYAGGGEVLHRTLAELTELQFVSFDLGKAPHTERTLRIKIVQNGPRTTKLPANAPVVKWGYVGSLL